MSYTDLQMHHSVLIEGIKSGRDGLKITWNQVVSENLLCLKFVHKIAKVKIMEAKDPHRSYRLVGINT